MKTALIITGKQVQDHEFIYPYYRLKEEGYDITIALDQGKETTGILGTKIPCDSECKIISYEELTHNYDLLIIPGGAKCMEYLRQNINVLNFINKFTGRIGCICHGAQLLISAKRVSKLMISGYYSIKDDIINA
jgi:protease I